MVNARAFVLFYVCAVAHAASLHGAGGSDVRTSGRVDIDMHSAQGNSGVAHTRDNPSRVPIRQASGLSLPVAVPDASSRSQSGERIPLSALDRSPVTTGSAEATASFKRGPTGTSHSPHLRRTSEPDVTTEAATVYYTISEPVGGFRGVESSAAYSDLPVFPTSSFDPATSVTPRPGAVDPSLPPDASTIRVSASPSSTLEPASTSSTEDHDRNATYTRALIIVIVVQAVLLLALIVTLIVVLVRRRNASRMAREHRYVKISERFESPGTPRPNSFGAYPSRPETMYSLDQVPFIQHQPLLPPDHGPEHAQDHEHEEHTLSPSRRSSVSTVSRYSQ